VPRHATAVLICSSPIACKCVLEADWLVLSVPETREGCWVGASLQKMRLDRLIAETDEHRLKFSQKPHSVCWSRGRNSRFCPVHVGCRPGARTPDCRHTGSVQARQARTSLPPAHPGHPSTAIPPVSFRQLPEFGTGPPPYCCTILLPTPVVIHPSLALSMKSEENRKTAVRMVLVDSKGVAEAARSTRMSRRSLTRFLRYFSDTGGALHYDPACGTATGTTGWTIWS